MDDLDIFAAVIFFGDGMGDEEQEMPFDQAQRLPSLLAMFDTILIAEREGIGEGAHGRLETDAVLFQVARGFGRMPGKAHRWHDRNIIINLSLHKARRTNPKLEPAQPHRPR